MNESSTSSAPPVRRRTGLIVALAVAVVLAAAGTGTAIWLATRPAPAAPAASVPVLSGIAQPNPACTPAADRKLDASTDLSSIMFFGYIDGQQKEMMVAQALSQQIGGHKVEYIWYCPLRSQWH